MAISAHIPAEPAAIERALQQLWRGEGEASAIVCARTVNLVVCCSDAHDLEGLERTLAVLEGVPSCYETELFAPIVARIRALAPR